MYTVFASDGTSPIWEIPLTLAVPTTAELAVTFANVLLAAAIAVIWLVTASWAVSRIKIISLVSDPNSPTNSFTSTWLPKFIDTVWLATFIDSCAFGIPVLKVPGFSNLRPLLYAIPLPMAKPVKSVLPTICSVVSTNGSTT